jgi:tryptophan synthase alpha chain
MNRIQQTFQQLKKSGRKALIPYITPEFPLRGTTVPLLRALEKSGAAMIEIGIPFSDPLADGKTIQRSSEIALRHGATLPTILSAVREFRNESELPLLLMGYINPVLQYGVERFVTDCRNAGVDGLIIPDLPPEEAESLRGHCAQAGVSNVFLIAPTTPDERIRWISELSTDFSYCVSVTGVTGARASLGLNGSLDDFLTRVQMHSTKPFVVGFGVAQPEHVQRVWQWADGAVVGSSLLEAIQAAQSVEAAVQQASAFLEHLLS